VFLLFLTNAQAQWTSTHNSAWWTQTEITLDSLIADYWNGNLETTLPDSVVYTTELAVKFNTVDTTAFNSKTLTTAQLASKLPYADTTSSIAMQWELDSKQSLIPNLADTSKYLEYSDTTALHFVKLANKLDDSDTTTLLAMQWELDGKLSSLPDSVVYTSEIDSDTLDYSVSEINPVIKNATISRYDISNPAVADTFMIFWADDSLEVDSIQVYADDSTTIQIKMDATNMLGSAYLIDDGVSSTITSISEGTLLATKKARLYFTALGDNVKKVHLKIYWRYL